MGLLELPTVQKGLLHSTRLKAANVILALLVLTIFGTVAAAIWSNNGFASLASIVVALALVGVQLWLRSRVSERVEWVIIAATVAALLATHWVGWT